MIYLQHLPAQKLNTMNDETLKVIMKHLSEIKTSATTQQKLLEMTKKAVLDTSDVAYLFNRTVATIHLWRKKGLISAKEINGRHFYTWESIYELLNDKKS